MLKGQENLIKLGLFLTLAFGIYLLVAWASYSPLDNAWTVASSATTQTLNKTGSLGAWLIDVLLAMFGKVAFIAPLVLSFSSAYMLLFRLTERVTARALWFWLGSFASLMVGLSALANVILPNSPYYLSGGFIGGSFEQLLGNGLGQIAVLFLGLILTSIGFYFCSGQVLLQLGNRLYQWILNGKSEEKQPEKTVMHEENMGVNDSEVKGNAITESIPHTEPVSQLTDPSQFTRPNIYGLKPQTAEPIQEQVESVLPQVHIPTTQPIQAGTAELTDLSRFTTNTMPTPTLPTVNMPHSENEDIPTIFEKTTQGKESLEVAVEQPVMPKVRLNPTSQAAENSLKNENVAEVINGVETAPSVDIKPISPEPVQEPEFTQRVPNVKIKPLEDTVAPSREEILREVAELDDEKKEEPQTKYPNGGYGSSLIHPLLQKNTKKAEKPTTPLPTLDLLDQHSEEKQQMSEQEVREISMRIEQELANFRVKATVEDVLVGPVVTRYEIQPAVGTPASKITRLENDLARILMLGKIRITEFIKGKPYMGVETPNRHRQTVWLRDVFESEEFSNTEAILPMALGKDISGKSVVVDMAKMPHLLVAGQTGAGKSVGVNTMILSLLFKCRPDQLRLIMIDPKQVELGIYDDIPHLLTPVVTEPDKAENALRWAVEEMERRYLLLSSLRVRHIQGYNDKIKEADEVYGIPIPNPLWKPGDTMDKMPPPLEKMSYIVLVVDEFADLLMSHKQVEDYILRIAQKARAVGIHLILATQRPSTDVITGVLKANIPSRIAFAVASQIDSRTILDTGGAESLLGRGDMLYSANGSNEILRVHGAYMTDSEVERIADNWRARGKPNYIESITESREEVSEAGERNSGDLDELFDDVVEYIVESGVTSISGVQRRFGLGFTRAARIIDQLEMQGIISKPDNRGKREVLAR